MKIVKKITTFKNVKFEEGVKPLVICDIDYTFINSLYDLNKIYNMIQNDCNRIDLSSNVIKKFAIEWRRKSYNMGYIKQSDPDGFVEMIKTIKNLNGKLIFLTARGIQSHDKTIYDFIKVGLQNPEQYEIHYTNAEISKGEYIKKHNLIEGYTHVSFIDDYPSYIVSVLNNFPQINCYLFQCV